MMTSSAAVRFEELAREWQAARRGHLAAAARLATWLDVGMLDVSRAVGEADALAVDDEERYAVVATLRTRARIDVIGDGSAAIALGALQRAIVDALDRIDGFAPRFQSFAADLLAERPRLDALRGRARLLEELRRDVLREPRLPLPEGLDELLDDASDVTPFSPPIRALESAPAPAMTR